MLKKYPFAFISQSINHSVFKNTNVKAFIISQHWDLINTQTPLPKYLYLFNALHVFNSYISLEPATITTEFHRSSVFHWKTSPPLALSPNLRISFSFSYRWGQSLVVVLYRRPHFQPTSPFMGLGRARLPLAGVWMTTPLLCWM